MRAQAVTICAVALLLICCDSLRAGPVDDVRAGQDIAFQEFSTTLTIKYRLVFLWISVSTNLATGPFVSPKDSGTLDIHLDIITTNIPGLPPMALSATELSGDRIEWNMDQDINEYFDIDIDASTWRIYVSNVTARLTAQATSIPPVYDQLTRQMRNVRLDRHGGDSNNFFMLTGRLISPLPGPLKVEATNMDFYAFAGLAEMPEPTLVVEWDLADGGVSFGATGLVENAVYTVLCSTDLMSTNWTAVASFTNAEDLANWSLPLTNADETCYFRLVTGQ